MTEHDAHDIPAAELADCVEPLPEWDRLRVRDYWDAVVAEELGAPEPVASPETWSDLGSSERVRLRRYRRRTQNTVLRLVTAAVEDPAVLDDGEAA